MTKTSVFLFLTFLKSLIANSEAFDYSYYRCSKNTIHAITSSVRLICSDRGGFTVYETETRPETLYLKCCWRKCSIDDFSEYCRLSLADVVFLLNFTKFYTNFQLNQEFWNCYSIFTSKSEKTVPIKHLLIQNWFRRIHRHPKMKLYHEAWEKLLLMKMTLHQTFHN